MDHSIRFANNVPDLYLVNPIYGNIRDTTVRHTYYDWFLMPEERYSIEPPELKESYVDVPGANGALDYSEALTLYPTYKNIEGSMSFLIENDRIIKSFTRLQDRPMYWNNLYNEIKTYLHGRCRYMLLEDNPEWYYYGRFTVGKYDSSDGKISKITISYNLMPFRRLCWLIDDTYWDSINLRPRAGLGYNSFDQMRNNLQNITIDSVEYFQVHPYDSKCGIMPTVPTFTVKRLDNEPIDVTLRFWNTNIGMTAHEFQIDDPGSSYDEDTGIVVTDRQIVFTNTKLPTAMDPDNWISTDWVLDAKGKGIISIDYDLGVI